MHPAYPLLYQINTRVWMTELSRILGRSATLDDISDSDLDKLKDSGFDWIWLLSVWQTGEEGKRISREHSGWRKEFLDTLPDLTEEDIEGSGFAIKSYTVSDSLGGDEALSRLRQRMAVRGLRLMLDFVPNHMGPDHSWAIEHPDYFIRGTESDIGKEPQNFTRIKQQSGDQIFAYGRDPFFDGWPDTLQLDYSNPEAAEAMSNELLRISDQCDGVRCDMAMLILPEVFKRTWGRTAEPFWPKAIMRVRERKPGFCFMAEVYWDMEWTMQQQGFDYAYDKRLYDRLVTGEARAVREHFYAGLDYQQKLARFLENHDEPRAASPFPRKNHEAAAIITFLAPGLRFFHQGQFEGRKKRISPHLVRAPEELVDLWIRKFYGNLITILKKTVFRDGDWRLLDCSPAWDGNGSAASFIIFSWQGKDDEKMLVTVNYSPFNGQCYVRLPFTGMEDKSIIFTDTLSTSVYERDGNQLISGGLYLDLPAWGYHVFEVKDA